MCWQKKVILMLKFNWVFHLSDFFPLIPLMVLPSMGFVNTITTFAFYFSLSPRIQSLANIPVAKLLGTN